MSRTRINCYHCGRESYSENGVLPNSWKVKTAGGFLPRNFCSDKCYRETKENRANDKVQKKEAQQISAYEKEVNETRKIEADAMRKEALAKEKIAQAEADRIEREIKLKEKESRNARADELRSQGKNYQAIFEQYSLGKVFVFIGSFLVFFIAIFLMMKCTDSDKKEAYNRHIELEMIETKVLKAIQNGNHEEALNYVEQLNHNSDISYKLGTYQTYWQKKKLEFKNEILGLGKTEDKEVKIDEIQNQDLPSPSTDIEESSNNNNLSNLENYSQNENHRFIITEKAFFYEQPNHETKKRSYLIKDQNIEIIEEMNDFYNVVYVNDKGNSVKGWMLKTDISR